MKNDVQNKIKVFCRKMDEFICIPEMALASTSPYSACANEMSASTAQHSTAQHSTAQHSIAQHRSTEISVALTLLLQN